GAVLGDFYVVRTVGRGGMGVVYEAVQVSLGRHVALKVLPAPNAAEPTYLERFQREAQAAARLHHSNIVPVFGVGEHHGVHFYAMRSSAGGGRAAALRGPREPRGPAADPQAPSQTFPTGPASGAASAPTVPDGPSLAGLDGLAGPAYFRAVARVGLAVA